MDVLFKLVALYNIVHCTAIGAIVLVHPIKKFHNSTLCLWGQDTEEEIIIDIKNEDGTWPKSIEYSTQFSVIEIQD